MFLEGVKNKESRCQYSTGILYFVISMYNSCFSISFAKIGLYFRIAKLFRLNFSKVMFFV